MKIVKIRNKRDFAKKLFEEIESRLDKSFTRRRNHRCFDDKQAGMLASKNASISLTRLRPDITNLDFEEESLERLASQSQNALDLLEKWY